MMAEENDKSCGKEVIPMATQIAATSVIKGPEAIKILKEANRKLSKESEKGAKKLAEIFDRMMK